MSYHMEIKANVYSYWDKGLLCLIIRKQRLFNVKIHTEQSKAKFQGIISIIEIAFS